MSEKNKILHALLIELENEMQQAGYWKGAPPPASAFESAVPFAVDTMAFNEWIQFVFIARLHAIIEAGAELPSGSQILPMAEQAWSGEVSLKTALKIIDQVDQVLGRPVN